jgi:ABC-type multidrug transport system ATPase subunit
MLTVENVTKRFGEIVALDRVSLSLARGEFFGLLGPNGAGKTTLMSLVAGLRAPDSDAETLAFFAEHLGRLSKTREDVKTWFEFGELDDYVSFGGKA